MIMKKNLVTLSVIFLCLFFAACGGKESGKEKGKESATSIAQKWCDLNAKVEKAATDEEKDIAKEARKKYENEMDAKYKGDEAFKKELEKEVNKCEAASEGR